MRNYIIEMLGGVSREVYHDAEAERANYTKNYYLMSDKAAKLEQTLNEKISEIGQLQELLRISKAAVERVENERANCSEGWTTANERVAALEERLQFDPQGGDKIDELESAMDNLQHQLQLATTTAADCAAKNEELAERVAAYEQYSQIVSASVQPRTNDAGKVTSYSLDLDVSIGGGEPVVITPRVLAASKKNAKELTEICRALGFVG